MSNRFEVADDFLDNLSDEDLYLLIRMIPIDVLLEPVKKNQKEFKKELQGLYLHAKSKLLMKRLPEAYFVRIRDHHNIGIINFVKGYVNSVVKDVKENIAKETLNEYYLEEALSSNRIDRELIELILNKLEPDYVKLFFKLIDYELTDKQSYYIDIQIENMLAQKKLIKKAIKQVKEGYESTLTELRNDYETKLAGKEKTIKDLNAELSEEKNNKKRLLGEAEAKIQRLEQKIKNDLNERQQLELKLKEWTSTIEGLRKQLQMKYDEYSIMAQKRWEAENEKLLEERRTIVKECEKLKKTKTMLLDDIKDLETKKIQLENKVSEYESVIYDFVENIDVKVIEEALRNSLLNITTNNHVVAHNAGYVNHELYIKSHESKTLIQKCTNIYDFAESIGTNLENIGVKGIADEAANFVIGILASGMVPLICGYKAREVATAISYSYNGETPYIITLPTGFTNAKALLETYNSTDASVVLIEDAVGTMNENAILPLLRERVQSESSAKLLLLATENMDSVRYMPLNLFNQVALVRINNFGISDKNEYEVSDARLVLKEFASANISEKESKEVRKLLDGLKLGKPYKALRSIILGFSSQISTIESALQGYLRFELGLMCKHYNLLADLENNIQKYRLGDALMEIVRDDLDG